MDTDEITVTHPTSGETVTCAPRRARILVRQGWTTDTDLTDFEAGEPVLLNQLDPSTPAGPVLQGNPDIDTEDA